LDVGKDSDIPTQMISGAFYLDVDPISFRKILSILSGVASAELLTSRISSLEVSLLISTARYLLCLDIAEMLEGMQMRERALEVERDEAIDELAKMKDSDELHLTKTILTQTVHVLHCPGYLTRRSGNRCACEIMIIGPADMKNFKLECTKCENARRDGKETQFYVPSPRAGGATEGKVKDVGELKYILDSLEKQNK
jgi:hypothetical protein